MSGTLQRTTRRRLVVLGATVVSVVTAVSLAAPVGAQPSAADLQLEVQRTIRTTPFINTKVSMKDSEGSTYVPRDKSLWLLDDDGRRAYVVNPRTGRLKRVINKSAFENARRYGGGRRAGANRSQDLESLAYDRRSDTLYAFSGVNCCKTPKPPTAFRLVRNKKDKFRVQSFQPLPKGSDFTAAAWNPESKRLFVAETKTIQRYRYKRNKLGPKITVPDLNEILGMEFTPSGKSLLVARGSARLSRVNWRTRKLGSDWRAISLAPHGVVDSRAVVPIARRLYISEGSDARQDRLRHAVFVFSHNPG